jgi:hypothetical protein
MLMNGSGCVGTAVHDLIVVNYRASPVDVKIDRTTYPIDRLKPHSSSFRQGAVTTNVIHIIDSRSQNDILVIDTKNRQQYLHGSGPMIVEVR